MLEQGQKWKQEVSGKMFKEVLTHREIERVCEMSSQELKGLSEQTGRMLMRKIKHKPNQVVRYLSNYHQVLMGMKQHVGSQVVNNLSLHFINSASYVLIQDQKMKEARTMLKNCIPYLESTNPDALLLSVALNNLSVLTAHQEKYYKALYYVLRAMQIMQIHIRVLKHSQRRDKLVEDMVILINSYLLVYQHSQQIMKHNHKGFYAQLGGYAYHRGMRKSVKYLGEESYFTKRFRSSGRGENAPLGLPIYRQTEEEETLYEERIINQLRNIEKMLSTQNTQPVYLPPPLVKEPEPEIILGSNEKIYKRIVIIHSWEVEVQMVYDQNQDLATISFNCAKDSEKINLVIGSKRMAKILSQMNLQDVMPNDCSSQDLQQEDFIRYCILNFFDIDDLNKNIQLHPRCTGLLQNIETFKTLLLDQQYIVFLNYIHCNLLRLALCPVKSSKTLHLDLELKQSTIEEMIGLPRKTSKQVLQVYNLLMEIQQKKKVQPALEQEKIEINLPTMMNILRSLLKKFEEFLKEQIDENVQKNINCDDYYKFQQINQVDQGRFFYIRFLESSNGFEVYLKNTEKSYCPDGLTNTRGNTVYHMFQFYRDFGLHRSEILLKKKCFAELISKKYSLKSFSSPLRQNQVEMYAQNAIVETKLTLKTFRRKMIKFGDYYTPITVGIMSVNNTIPIGLKVSGYDLSMCVEISFFIYLFHKDWEWPNKSKEEKTDDYPYKSQYFLVDWLERFGFHNILEMLVLDDDTGHFFIKGTKQSHFKRINKIIDFILH